MKKLQKIQIIMLLTATTIIAIAAAFLMLHRKSEAELPVSVTAKVWGGYAGTYDAYRVFEEDGRYYIENSIYRNTAPIEIYEITKEEFVRSVNKELLQTESLETLVKRSEEGMCDGYYSRSVVRYKDGTEKEVYDTPFLNEFVALIDSKRLAAGINDGINKESNRIEVAFTDICYKYRVGDAKLTILNKTEDGEWRLPANGTRGLLYRGDDTEITPIEAARYDLYNDELQNVYGWLLGDNDDIRGRYPGSWSQGDDTVAVYLDEASGSGIIVYIRSSDRIVRPMLLHEMKSILKDKDKQGCSDMPYIVIRILEIILIEVLIVISAIFLFKAEKQISKKLKEKIRRYKWAYILAPVILLLTVFILRHSTGKVKLNEATGELTISGDLSRQDILKYAHNSNVISIIAKEGTRLPKDCHGLFSVYVEDATKGMGPNWSCLKYVDLSKADTSGVTDMSCMFRGCGMVEKLDLSGFDTSEVTSMESMFDGCYHVKTIDTSSFDTSRVTSMESMFKDCHQLETINTSGFDTSNVTTMAEMFDDCKSLRHVDLSRFDTSRVTDMHMMFSGCMNLWDFEVTSFDTSNVTYMSYMFHNCYAIRTLDLSSFDTSGVTESENMIHSMRDIKKIYVSEDTWTLRGNYIEQRYKSCVEFKSALDG